jgi:hypothetical protein
MTSKGIWETRFFHEARVRFGSEDRRQFGFDSVGITMFDGADIYKHLEEFR